MCAVFVDAGYLLASAATRTTGSSLRSGIVVDYRKLIRSIIAESERIAQLAVLRVNWYDAAENGVPDQSQEDIGTVPKVRLRLGRFGVDGQQKGVDLRIGLDMVTLARNNAVDTIVLVSGDDDLTEAVEQAQDLGVTVIVLAVPNAAGTPNAVSRHLLRAADDLEILPPPALDASVRRPTQSAASASGASASAASAPKPAPVAPIPVPGPRPAPAPAPTRIPVSTPAYSSGTGGTPYIAPEYAVASEELTAKVDAVVADAWGSFVAASTPAQIAAVRAARPSIPRELDRALLADLSDKLGVYTLTDPERYALRDRFWVWLDSTT
ncbi:NYN domain-containing protein [Microbacterium sp.]|uniref:NYN domain-containing protein n=1 Tax=Microbacterium sp. TaxID=51671 RepID=UPI0039E56E52